MRFGAAPYSLNPGALGGVRVNAANDAWEVFTPQAAYGAQTATHFLAGPTPSFRAIAAADLGSGSGGSTKFLREDSTWQALTPTAPAGSNQQIQYNNSGAFGGHADLVFDGAHVHVNSNSAGRVTIGELLGFDTYGGIWIGQASPNTNNYAFMGTTNVHLFNAPSQFEFRINNVNKATIDGVSFYTDMYMSIGAGSSPSAKLHVISTGEQFHSGYSNTQKWKANTDSAGITTFDAVGTAPSAGGRGFVFADSVRIKKGVRTQTDVATLTPNIDSYDMEVLTAQNQSLTIANPTGTPTEGQPLVIRIHDDATLGDALTWGAKYRNTATGSPTLPTNTSTGGQTDYMQFLYNETEDFWDLQVLVQGF